MTSAILPSRHLSGFFWLAAGQAVARAMTLVAMGYLARVLGVEIFGVLGLAAAIAAYFLLIVDAGLDLIGMRAIARDKSSVENVISSILLMRLSLGALAATGFIIIAPWFASSSTALGVMFAYSVTLFSFASNPKWSFQAMERHSLVAVALVLSQSIYLLGVIVLVRSEDDAFKVPLLLFGSELTGAAWLFFQYYRQGFRLRWPASSHLSRSLIIEALPLAGTQAVRALAINFDLILLALVGHPVAVGLYTAVSRIIMLLREFGSLYFLPLFPQLSRAAQEAADRFQMLGEAGIRHSAALIFPFLVGGVLTGPNVLSYVFGPPYAQAASALSLLLMAVAFTMLTGVYRFGLIAFNRQGTVFRVMTLGTVLNIAMNLILVPRYSLVGAALSALVTEAVIFFVMWLTFIRLVPVSPWRPMVRPTMAAAGMAIILWLLPPWPFPLVIAIAATSYFAFALLSGAINLHELTDAWHQRSPAIV